jgi:flagellar hook assembly protein FlgD
LYSFAYVILEKPTYVKNLIQEISDFELQGPYPNPFNSQTSIQVNIPEKSYVEISIYDILAQKVKVIYSGTLNRGIYTFYWDGKNEKLQDLSSGVYLCILKATRDKKTEILTRKIILMK